MGAALAAIDMGRPKSSWEIGSAARDLSWCKLYALSTEYDVLRVTLILTSAIAVSEEDVRQSVDAFRDRIKRAADIEGSILEIASNRDRDRAEATRDGEPVRGA